MFNIFKKKKPKPKKDKSSIFKRPYRSYINIIYSVMFYGKKITILPDFRKTPTATQGYVAGISKLGYIIIDVIDGDQNSRHYYEAYMLD